MADRAPARGIAAAIQRVSGKRRFDAEDEDDRMSSASTSTSDSMGFEKVQNLACVSCGCRTAGLVNQVLVKTILQAVVNLRSDDAVEAVQEECARDLRQITDRNGLQQSQSEFANKLIAVRVEEAEESLRLLDAQRMHGEGSSPHATNLNEGALCHDCVVTRFSTPGPTQLFETADVLFSGKPSQAESDAAKKIRTTLEIRKTQLEEGLKHAFAVNCQRNVVRQSQKRRHSARRWASSAAAAEVAECAQFQHGEWAQWVSQIEHSPCCHLCFAGVGAWSGTTFIESEEFVEPEASHPSTGFVELTAKITAVHRPCYPPGLLVPRRHNITAPPEKSRTVCLGCVKTFGQSKLSTTGRMYWNEVLDLSQSGSGIRCAGCPVKTVDDLVDHLAGVLRRRRPSSIRRSTSFKEIKETLSLHFHGTERPVSPISGIDLLAHALCGKDCDLAPIVVWGETIEVVCRAESRIGVDVARDVVSHRMQNVKVLKSRLSACQNLITDSGSERDLQHTISSLLVLEFLWRHEQSSTFFRDHQAIFRASLPGVSGQFPWLLRTLCGRNPKYFKHPNYAFAEDRYVHRCLAIGLRADSVSRLLDD